MRKNILTGTVTGREGGGPRKCVGFKGTVSLDN
jgi:hypothetical protein